MNSFCLMFCFLNVVLSIDYVSDISSDFTKIRYSSTLNNFTNEYGHSYILNSAHKISPCAGFIKVTGLEHVVGIDKAKDLLIFSKPSLSGQREVISMKPFNELDYSDSTTYQKSEFASPMYLPLNRISSATCDISADTIVYVDHYRSDGGNSSWVYQNLGEFMWNSTGASDGHEDVEWSSNRTLHTISWTVKDPGTEIGRAHV